MQQPGGTTIAPVDPRKTPVSPALAEFRKEQSRVFQLGGSRRRYLAIRALAERTAAAVMLALCLPVIAVAGLLIKLTSRGPIFYTQIRLGEGGRPYLIYKLRTMQDKCEEKSGPRWATVNDARITRVGEVLRKVHIDELPQLWNVLRSEMSLVGPRPERPEFVPALAQGIPKYRERLLVPPGLTGLAQLLLPADTDLESARKKLILDRHYVHHINWWLDCRLLLGTPCYLLGVPREVTRKLLGLPDLAAARRQVVRETIRVSMEVTPEFSL